MPNHYWNFDFDDVDEPMQVVFGPGRQKINKNRLKKPKYVRKLTNHTNF